MRFLRHVARLVVVAHDSADDSVHALVVAAHDDLEEIRLAVTHTVDDGIVFELGLVCHQGETPRRVRARSLSSRPGPKRFPRAPTRVAFGYANRPCVTSFQ